MFGNKIKLAMLSGLILSASATANIHDPHSSFLLRALPSLSELNDPTDSSALATEQAYLQEVVGDAYDINESALNSFTLSDWKTNNGFDDAIEIETMDGWDDAADEDLLATFGPWDSSLAKEIEGGTPSYYMRKALSKISVDYFNSGDLGLGRRMTCVKQTTDIATNKLPSGKIKELAARGEGAMACYVTNYGAIGGSIADNVGAFPEDSENPNFADGEGEAFATVAMEIWPGQASNKVRFFVFAKSGGPGLDDDKLAYASAGSAEFTSIKLDNGKGHSQPGICMACHGGEFGSASTVNGAHFLPFDMGAFSFADEQGRSSTAELRDIKRKAKKKFAALNFWILDAERRAYGIDSNIANYLGESQGFIEKQTPWSPPPITSDSHLNELGYLYDIARNGNYLQDEDYVEPAYVGEQQLYKEVYAPYCRGCHLATYSLPPILTESYFCVDENMPHAEVNLRNMLNEAEKIESITGQSCLPSLLDFESETIDGDSSFFHEKLAESTAKIGITSTASTLVADTIKRTAQTDSSVRNTVKLVLAHDVDAAQESDALKTNGTINTLAFQYYLTGVDKIAVKLMKGTEVKRVITIRDTLIHDTLDDTTNGYTLNDHPGVPFTHVGSKPFRIADLTPLLNDIDASYAIIELTNSGSSTPVEIDELLVDFDSTYQIIADSNTGLYERFGNLRFGSSLTPDGCVSGQGGPVLMALTEERKPTRGFVREVWGTPQRKVCTGNVYESSFTIDLDRSPFESSSTSKIVIAFDYHVDKNATVNARVNTRNGPFDVPATHNLIGLSEAVDENRVGRMRFAVPKSYLDSKPDLRLQLRYIPLALQDSGVHFNNFKVYLKP